MKCAASEPPGVDAAIELDRAMVSSQILRRVARSNIFCCRVSCVERKVVE